MKESQSMFKPKRIAPSANHTLLDRLVEIGQHVERYSDRAPATLNTYIPDVLKGEPPTYRVRDVTTNTVTPSYEELEIATPLKTLVVEAVKLDDSDAAVYDITVSAAVEKSDKKLTFLPPTYRPHVRKRVPITAAQAAELFNAWEGLVRAVHARATHFNNIRRIAVEHAKATGLLWRQYFVGIAEPGHMTVAGMILANVESEEAESRTSATVPLKREAGSLKVEADDLDGRLAKSVRMK